jgi:predicted ATPase
MFAVHSDPFHVNSPFHPFIKQLERAAGIVRTDTAAQKLDKLESILEGSTESRIEDVSLLAALMSIPFGERYPRLQITELVQKQRTMELLEEQLVRAVVRCWLFSRTRTGSIQARSS